MTVAQTIRKHITDKCRSAFLLWDASDTLHTPTGLRFKVNGKRRCVVRVEEVASHALYDIAFGVFRGKTWVEHFQIPGVLPTELFKTIDGYVS